MSIRIGVYQFFARTIPGGFYIFSLLHLCNIFGLVKSTWQTLNTISLIWALIFATLAFVIGSMIDPLSLLWHDLFRPKHFCALVLEEFKARHKDWEIKAKSKDWPILLAYLRRDNLEAVIGIESHNAIAIMQRNISLNFAVLSLIHLILSFRNYALWNVGLSIAFALSAMLSVLQATKYRRWFYASIYEAFIAQELNRIDYVQNIERTNYFKPQVEAGNLSSDASFDTEKAEKTLTVVEAIKKAILERL